MATVGPLLAALVALLAGAWLVRRSVWFRKRVYRRLRSPVAIEARLQSAVERTAARFASSTVVVGIVRPRQPPRIFAVGGEPLPAAPADCIFELGSITKPFTALTLARLHHLRGVSLDAPVVEIAPDWFPPATTWQDVTLRDLATHTSGLPRLPPDLLAGDATFADPYRLFDRGALLKALQSAPPSQRRRGRYLYSNFGYGLLGELLARIAGTSYQETVADTVLDPLGLQDISLHDATDVPPSLVPGRRRRGKPVSNWRFGSLAGAGALIGTARGLSRFVQTLLDPPADWAATMRLMFEPTVRIDRRRRVGLAWHGHRDPLLETDIWWHNGATGGYRALVAFAPKLDLGVVVLTNSSPFDLFTPSIDRLGLEILRCSAKLPAD